MNTETPTQNVFFNFEKIMHEDKQEDQIESYILNNILDDDDEESTAGSSDSCTENQSPNAVLLYHPENEEI